MSIIGLIIAVVIFLVVVAFLAIPFMTRESSTAGDFRNRQRERALAYYERVLRNIRDLDDDLATNKISQAEYDFERERWMERGVELLHMLEQLDEEHNISDDLQQNANDAQIDSAIDNAISTLHEQQTASEVS